MASRQFATGLKRSALTVALGLCFAGAVQAQSSVGSINGDAAAGSTVNIQNVDTGLSREVTVDANGRFNFPQLAPGHYKVTSNGQTRDVQVKVGTGSTVSFAPQELGAVEVIGGAASFNPIDVSSVESTTVFTAEQIDALPVARDVTNVALLAPGTVRGDSGLGNLASFGGASVAENGYYINGFDVTNIRNFISFADLPFDAISEQQVKTGGYGAEYGRSLGGVVSIVTKRGTNDWTGGASAYWAPDWAQEHGKDVISRTPGGGLLAYRSDNEADELTYNVYGGGPLIKDKLFFFGLIQGQKNTQDNFFDVNSEHRSNTDPSGMVKLDWNLTDDHVFELTGIWNEDTQEVTAYENPAGQVNTGVHGSPTANYTIENGG
ncbi:MAG: TonB-dependent receptor, partial [Lysobacter sp.]|nr:TonB-dependent receptor [Lysobacter sp.]